MQKKKINYTQAGLTTSRPKIIFKVIAFMCT